MAECLPLGKTKKLNIGLGAVEYITVRPLIMAGSVKIKPHVRDADSHGGRRAFGVGGTETAVITCIHLLSRTKRMKRCSSLAERRSVESKSQDMDENLAKMLQCMSTSSPSPRL